MRRHRGGAPRAGQPLRGGQRFLRLDGEAISLHKKI
jgi:hypothetical protein